MTCSLTGILTARRTWSLATVMLLALALVTALCPTPAAAHPLGNFTINRYSRIEFSTETVRVVYVLDFAEIPSLQQMELLDIDDDGEVSDIESERYLNEIVPLLVKGLRLIVGDHVLPLSIDQRSLEMLPGEGGLPILRIDVLFSSSLPDDWASDGHGGYTDRNYQDRLGWREVVVQGGPGVAIESSTAPEFDISQELRAYPEGSLNDPLDRAEATFTLVRGDGTPAGRAETAADAADRVRAETNGGRATDRVANLITKEQTIPVFLVSLVLAFGWGAVHALSPGHGKAVVAAYLVGARGTAKHAAILGLTVTLTHTAGVFALGLVTLYLSHYILPEKLYPWLSVISGLLVVAIGVTLIWNRVRARPADDHTHDYLPGGGSLVHSHGGRTHSHLPPGADGARVTWRSLLALGVSGGLIPCPSALVLLLGAISLGRTEVGMILVVAFSFGLAAVLTGIGLLLVYARRFFERRSFTPRVPRLVPIASAFAVSLAGLAIVIGSLQQTGVM